MSFISAREAVGYYLACSKGPTIAKPRYAEVRHQAQRPDNLWVLIGALIYGPEDSGCCGVERGSQTDHDLRRYVTAQDENCRTKPVRRVLRQLSGLLSEAGMRVIVRKPIPRPKPSAYVEHLLVDSYGKRVQPPRLLCEVTACQ